MGDEGDKATERAISTLRFAKEMLMRGLIGAVDDVATTDRSIHGGGGYGKIHCISAQNMIDDTMLKFELGQHILCSLVNIMSLAPPCKNAADY